MDAHRTRARRVISGPAEDGAGGAAPQAGQRAPAGRADGARVELETALELDPDDARTLVELGNLELAEGNRPAAIARFRQAVAADSTAPDPIEALSLTLVDDGRLDEGEDLLRRAVRRLDRHRTATLHIALSRLLYGQAKSADDSLLMEESLEESRLALSVDGSSASAHFRAGMAYAGLEIYAKAEEHFRRAQSLDSAHVAAERNAIRIGQFRKADLGDVRRTRFFGNVIAASAGVALTLVWAVFLLGTNDELDGPHMVALTSVFFILVVVGAVLPRLSGLKLPGVEATLQEVPLDFGAGPSGRSSATPQLTDTASRAPNGPR